jgi:hypothetical protein
MRSILNFIPYFIVGLAIVLTLTGFIAKILPTAEEIVPAAETFLKMTGLL